MLRQASIIMESMGGAGSVVRRVLAPFDEPQDSSVRGDDEFLAPHSEPSGCTDGKRYADPMTVLAESRRKPGCSAMKEGRQIFVIGHRKNMTRVTLDRI